MRKVSKLKPIIISLLALTIIVALYLIASDFSFSSGKEYVVRFDYVGSVNTGTLVRKSGIKVGTVRGLKIDPEDQRSVLVRIQLESGHIVRLEDSFAIVSRGLLGDQSIEIFPGPVTSAEAAEDHLFQGEAPMDMSSVLFEAAETMKGISSIAASLEKLLGSSDREIESIIKNMDSFSAHLAEIGENSLAFSKDLKQLSESSENLMFSTNKTILETNENLKKALKSVADAARAIESTLTSLNRDDSTLSRLQDPENAEKIETSLDNIVEVSENLAETSETIRKAMESFFGFEDEE